MDRYLACIEEDIASSTRALDTLSKKEQQIKQQYSTKIDDLSTSIRKSSHQTDICQTQVLEAKEQLKIAETRLHDSRETSNHLLQARNNVIRLSGAATIEFDKERADIVKALQKSELEKQKVVKRLSQAGYITITAATPLIITSLAATPSTATAQTSSTTTTQTSSTTTTQISSTTTTQTSSIAATQTESYHPDCGCYRCHNNRLIQATLNNVDPPRQIQEQHASSYDVDCRCEGCSNRRLVNSLVQIRNPAILFDQLLQSQNM